MTQADFAVETVEVKGAAAQRTSPFFYGFLPLLPVVLLFVFSKFVYAEVRLELITAILFCCFSAFTVDLLTRRNFKEVVADTKSIFDGMGKVFTSTVILVICAEVFAEGLKRTGGIDAILNWASSIEGAGGIAMHLMMITIMAVASFVTGSGNAAFFAFSHFLPQCAKSVAWETIVLAAPVQLASGIARSMSPISGVTMAVAGLAGISPFELVRRTLPVMVFSLLLTIIASVPFV